MTWADSDYSYKKKITIDYTQVTGDEIDFPVLISMTDNDLRDEANGGHVKSVNGWDIVFYNSAEDTLLKHEIEYYLNTGGTLVYWVKVPSLSSTVDTDIYIYYGKAGVGADPSTTDTWDNNFSTVQHMTDDTTNTVLDSTSNDYDGTKKGVNTPTEVAGKIHKCQEFARNDHYINYGDVMDNGLNDFTISGWFYFQDGSDNYVGVSKQLTGHDYSYQMFRGSGDDKFWTMIGRVNGVRLYEYTDPTTAIGTWLHLTYVMDRNGNDAFLYIDGSVVGTTQVIQGGFDDTDDISNSLVFVIGGFNSSSGVPSGKYYGKIDEVRVSNSVRSANWLGTSFNTQDDPGAFVSWGAEEEEEEEEEIPTEYTSFDPRKSIREKIGTSNWHEEDGETWNISVLDNYNHTIRIPIYLAEEVKTESLREMPYITLNIDPVKYIVNNVQGDKRKCEANIKIELRFANTDNIDVTSFGKKIIDEFQDEIRTNQCLFTGIDFITLKEVAFEVEGGGHQVAMHYTMLLYAEYYDLS